MSKHCPYCRHLLKLEDGTKNGTCDRCGKDFTVKYHLTKIRLNKIFIPRNYEAEVYGFIVKKRQTYAGEISCNIGASKGVISHVLKMLHLRGAIKVVPRGKTKWVMLPETEFVMRRRY